MNRRKFITLLSGTAAWPLSALAQEAGRKYRWLMSAFDAVDGSSIGTSVPSKWVLLSAHPEGGAHADGYDDWP